MSQVAPPAAAAAASIAPSRCASPSTAGAIRAMPATRWPRRCSPTASRWSARSFKYHRPRGIVAARRRGAERAGPARQRRAHRAQPARHADRALRRPDRRQPELLAAASTSTSARSTSLFSPLFPAGFYYKTFMWPQRFWMSYEHFIRRAAGLGTRPTEPDPDRYDKLYAHCDVLVVGGGPAGLAAALAAGRARRTRDPRRRAAGAGRPLLADAHRHTIDGSRRPSWVADALAELARDARGARCCRAPPPSATTTTTGPH